MFVSILFRQFIVTEFCGGGSLDSYLIKYVFHVLVALLFDDMAFLSRNMIIRNGHLLAQLQRISMIVAACKCLRFFRLIFILLCSISCYFSARGVRHLHSQVICALETVDSIWFARRRNNMSLAQLIVHRDLAVRNFLLTIEGGLKVADFGNTSVFQFVRLVAVNRSSLLFTKTNRNVERFVRW